MTERTVRGSNRRRRYRTRCNRRCSPMVEHFGFQVQTVPCRSPGLSRKGTTASRRDFNHVGLHPETDGLSAVLFEGFLDLAESLNGGVQ